MLVAGLRYLDITLVQRGPSIPNGCEATIGDGRSSYILYLTGAIIYQINLLIQEKRAYN